MYVCQSVQTTLYKPNPWPNARTLGYKKFKIRIMEAHQRAHSEEQEPRPPAAQTAHQSTLILGPSACGKTALLLYTLQQALAEPAARAGNSRGLVLVSRARRASICSETLLPSTQSEGTGEEGFPVQYAGAIFIKYVNSPEEMRLVLANLHLISIAGGPVTAVGIVALHDFAASTRPSSFMPSERHTVAELVTPRRGERRERRTPTRRGNTDMELASLIALAHNAVAHHGAGSAVCVSALSVECVKHIVRYRQWFTRRLGIRRKAPGTLATYDLDTDADGAEHRFAVARASDPSLARSLSLSLFLCLGG